MSALDAALRLGLPLLPRRLLWLVARRYVAGDELADALARLAELRAQGFGAILDVLGEGVDSEAGARAAAAEYQRAVAALRGVDEACEVSVKPTHLGLLVDRRLCEEQLAALCAAAGRDGRRVRLEMEDSPTIDDTLAVFEAVRRRHDNLGCVLQARLFRTGGDVERLLARGGRLDVRLVKGIYVEPPEIAWVAPADISASYLRLARTLVDGGAFAALATHDGALADGCVTHLRAHGLAAGERWSRAYEFQCLMGVRTDWAAALRDQGHPVRIYVPYGRDWHAYSLRRMNKNPAIARAVLRALVGLDR